MRDSFRDMFSGLRCAIYLRRGAGGDLWGIGETEADEVLHPSTGTAIAFGTLNRRELTVLNDAMSSPDYNAEVDAATAAAPHLFSVPITYHESCVGVLQVASDKKFDTSDAETAVSLATLIAVALRSSDSLEQERRATERYQALASMVELVLEQNDPKALLQLLRVEAQALLNVEAAIVYIVDRSDTDAPTLLSYAHDSDEVCVPLSSSAVAALAARSASSVHVADAKSDRRFDPAHEPPQRGESEIRNLLIHPIMFPRGSHYSAAAGEGKKDGTVLGVVQVINTQDMASFTTFDSIVLKSFAQLAGAALANALLFSATLSRNLFQEVDFYGESTTLVAEPEKEDEEEEEEEVENGDEVKDKSHISSSSSSSAATTAAATGAPVPNRPLSAIPVLDDVAEGPESPGGAGSPATRRSTKAALQESADIQFSTSLLGPLAAFAEWNFNVLDSSPQELCDCIVAAFRVFALHEIFDFPPGTLESFISRVMGLYHDTPFHNWFHACQVFHVVFMSFVASKTLRESLNALDVLSIFIATITHDIDHRGTTNAFHINSGSSLALRYNDRSVMENHHCAMCFSLMSEKQCNILANLTKASFSIARKLICSAILGTDMSSHHMMLTKMKGHANYPFKRDDLEDRQMLLSLVLHSADLSNPTLELAQSRTWEECVMREFSNQNVLEQQLNLPMGLVVNMQDAIARHGNQIFFIETFAGPLWQLTVSIIPELQPRYAVLKQNLSAYYSFKMAAMEAKANDGVEAKAANGDAENPGAGAAGKKATEPPESDKRMTTKEGKHDPEQQKQKQSAQEPSPPISTPAAVASRVMRKAAAAAPAERSSTPERERTARSTSQLSSRILSQHKRRLSIPELQVEPPPAAPVAKK